MKSNKQGNIKVPKSGFKRSRFNWTHDVNTTFSWGEVQPTQCKLLIPNSKTSMSTQSLIRLAPMVVPTFGRVKYKTFNQFVSIAEIFPNFDAMMAMEPVSTADFTKIPSSVPYCKLSVLSSLVLNGARASLHFAEDTNDGKTAQQNAQEGYYITYYRSSPSASAPSSFQSHLNHINVNNQLFSFQSDVWNRSSNGVLPAQAGLVMILKGLSPVFSSVYSGSINLSNVVLGAHSVNDLCPVVRDYVPSHSSKSTIPDYAQEVTFEGADYVIEGSVDYEENGQTKTEYFALTLELSDFGKRIRKVLQGCGYQIDFTSTANVSILPLIAQYKAYFDIFGLELYQGWETTWCSKMIKYIENGFMTDMSSCFIRTLKQYINYIDENNIGLAFFLQELSNEFYTDDVDYISSHIQSLSISSKADLNDQFISVFGSVSQLSTSPNIGDAQLSSQVQPDGSYADSAQVPNTNIGVNAPSLGALNFINSVNHSEVDAELLKRLYKWTNRNTILGRRIADLLRAQGLGKYVDECKSNYIGSTDTIVTISDVVSTAATDDAVLGEYGGKGLQYTEGKTLVFENDSFGYWITLACIVPEAGYTQGLDTTLTSIAPMDFYRPDFDAIGMELTPKRSVVSTNYLISSSQPNFSHVPFGFVPRMSKFKVVSNLVNGDFNRHSKRNVYLPYTLDKQLDINDYNVSWSKYDNSIPSSVASGTKLEKSARIEMLPVAGNSWRCPTKYEWLGNFNRIFYNLGYHDKLSPVYDDSFSTNAIGVNDYNDDNFLSHSIYEVNCYAPMKPIVESYGLDDDEPNFGSEFVSKA